MKKYLTKLTRKDLIFISFFALAGIIALQIPFTNLAGSKVNFTLFDFFAPVITGFIGTLPGVLVVLTTQVINLLIHGTQSLDVASVIRLFPILFAGLYFSKKSQAVLLVPILAIVLFIIHPVGRTVAYYSLFWTIPIVCHFFRDKSLFARSLGATFTAHAVGGAAWIYALNIPKPVWDSLIPIVFQERLIFALGTLVAYIVINNLLSLVNHKHLLAIQLPVDEKYVWLKA